MSKHKPTINAQPFDQYLYQQLIRQEQLQQQLMSSDTTGFRNMAELSRELARLNELSSQIQSYQQLQSSLKGCDDILNDNYADQELQQLAIVEKTELIERIASAKAELELAILPPDSEDNVNSIILEVRAGTGGSEAALFAGDLLNMYRRYAEQKNFRFELIDVSENDLGGVSTGSASIKGKGVFEKLKYEGGVHRVQRVPVTENAGRVHTSTATVAILPEPEEVEIVINPEDLRIDTYRSQGAGGQHVNTTDSAVRITHLPSGLAVACQTEKSQHKNRAQAMRLLRARLFEHQRIEKEMVRVHQRRSMIGSAMRAEKIRTYNFPENRVSDHRIKLTLYKLAQILSGEALDEVIEPLHTADLKEKLEDFIAKLNAR